MMRALSSPPFNNYRAWWSLSDSKYAGTALIIKKCFQPKTVFFNLDKKGTMIHKILVFHVMKIFMKPPQLKKSQYALKAFPTIIV